MNQFQESPWTSEKYVLYVLTTQFSIDGCDNVNITILFSLIIQFIYIFHSISKDKHSTK